MAVFEELPVQGDRITGADIPGSWETVCDTVSHRMWRSDAGFVIGYKRRQSFGRGVPDDGSATTYEVLSVGNDVMVDLVRPSPIDFLAGQRTAGWSLSSCVDSVQREALEQLLRAGETGELMFMSADGPRVGEGSAGLVVSAEVTDARVVSVLDALESAIQDGYDRQRRQGDAGLESELERFTGASTPSPEEILRGCERYLYTGFVTCIDHVDEGVSSGPYSSELGV